MVEIGSEEARLELDRAHGEFDIALHRSMTWLEDALARRDRATGFDKVKLQGIVVLAEKAAAVFAVSAFERFMRAALHLGGAVPGEGIHSFAELGAMLRESWGLDLDRTVMKRGQYLDLLLAWRRDIIHEGDLPSEGFRRCLEEIYGPQAAASWIPEAPRFPGPGGVTALVSNLAECEFLTYNELRAKLGGPA